MNFVVKVICFQNDLWIFFFFWCYCLMLAKQVLYDVNQTSNPFCYSCFSDSVLCFCPIQLGHDPPLCLLHRMMTDTCNQAQLIG